MGINKNKILINLQKPPTLSTHMISASVKSVLTKGGWAPK